MVVTPSCGYEDDVMLEKNHYIQKSLLNNFATRDENGIYRICVLNLHEFTATFKSTAKAFYEKNLYDVASDDDKELEKKFNDLVEKPMNDLRARLMAADGQVTVTRRELNAIKKYLLLQIYRTPGNRISYTNPKQNSFELSQYNIREDESKEDFWKREMLTIIDSDWEELGNIDMVGIKKNYKRIHEDSFLLLVRTKQEFCINDRGFVTERLPITIPKEKQEEYIRAAKEFGKQEYGVDNFDEMARKEIENGTSYVENFMMFPISSELAILLVSTVWRDCYLNLLPPPFPSNILLRHMSYPTHDYVNKDKIFNDADILRYKTPDDKYTYVIHTLSEGETEWANHLMMNEAERYLALKTPSMFLKTIRNYNAKKYHVQNVKKDYGGFVALLSKLC